MNIFYKALTSKCTLFTFLTFFSFSTINAQTNSIIPFIGIKYFQEGITIKNVDVKINNMVLLNNRVPANKDFEFHLQKLAGLTADVKKMVFAAAEITILSAKGELLGTVPNALVAKATTGFAAKEAAPLIIKCNLSSAIIKTNTVITLKIKVYDLKGKNQLRLEFPLNITRPGEALLLSKISKELTTPKNILASINDIKVGGVKAATDTTVKQNPKMAFLALDILKIDGSSFVGILEGKEEFWVFDKNLNPIKPNEIILKEVKGTMEGTTVNSFVKIPYRLKTSAANGYVIRYRWHSNDLLQVIDVVVTL
jgi:hypothetical protein